MNTPILTRIVLFAMLISGVISCDFLSQGHMNASIFIDLGGSLDDASSRAVGIVPGTIAAGITSFTITVNGPDIKTIQQQVSLGSRYVNISVPAGPDRTIRLDANMSQAFTSTTAFDREHVLSYAAEQTVDLRPGRQTGLRFTLETGMTKLIVPSRYNALFYRIPSMTPTLAEFVTNSTQMFEYDFEGTGRIAYVPGGTNLVWMIDDINPSTTPLSYNSGLTYANMVTVDNINNRLYMFGTSASTGATVIQYVNFPAGTSNSYTRPTNVSSVVNMEYRDGYLYMVGTNSTGVPSIFRYQPGAATAEVAVANPHMGNPQDILVKSDYIYVTNFPTDPYATNPPATNYACIELYDRKTLAYIGAYGNRIPYPGGTPVPFDNRIGYFYGPQHFIAPNNRKIYVIDDGAGTGSGQNRVVAFDDIKTWEGWEIFRTEDLNPSTEYRYYFC